MWNTNHIAALHRGSLATIQTQQVLNQMLHMYPISHLFQPKFSNLKTYIVTSAALSWRTYRASKNLHASFVHKNKNISRKSHVSGNTSNICNASYVCNDRKLALVIKWPEILHSAPGHTQGFLRRSRPDYKNYPVHNVISATSLSNLIFPATLQAQELRRKHSLWFVFLTEQSRVTLSGISKIIRDYFLQTHTQRNTDTQTPLKYPLSIFVTDVTIAMQTNFWKL